MNLLKNWKTTVQGILTAVISLSLIAPQLSFLTLKQAATLVSLGAIAKVVLGFFQQDAGTTEAITKSGEVKQVPSHEVPNDPSSLPIKESK